MISRIIHKIICTIIVPINDISRASVALTSTAAHALILSLLFCSFITMHSEASTHDDANSSDRMQSSHTTNQSPHLHNQRKEHLQHSSTQSDTQQRQKDRMKEDTHSAQRHNRHQHRPQRHISKSQRTEYDVKKGSIITVIYEKEALLIKISATALQNGNVGDAINARSSKNNKILRVKIISNTTASL